MFSPQSTFVSKRSFKPIIWNLLLQTTFLNVFIFVTQADILHPLKWFYDWYVYFVWQGSWLYILPLTIIVIGQGSASTEDYVKIQPFYSTRISLIRQVFTIHNIMIAMVHILIGFLIPWTYGSFIGDNYERMRYVCLYSNNYCLSEKRMFLIMGGMWVNFVYFIQSHFLGTRYLKFPVVQLPKFVLIKSKLFETIQTSIKWVILPDLVFLFLYFMKGGRLAVTFAEILNLTIEEERIDSFSGLLDLRLLIYLLVFSSMIIVSMRLMELFYRIYLTERYYFPFNSVQDDLPTLTDGLKMVEFPIIQHLAFLDLMLLCEHSKSRREEIYKLSSFGGHPHLWNAIKKSCTSLIDEFINDLEEVMKPPAPPTLSRQPIKSPLRRNVPDYFVNYKLDPNTSKLSPTTATKKPDPTLLNELKDRITRTPFYRLIFGDRKDMRIRHVLRLSLPIKWACESISFLACHSLSEDKYGILVNDLSGILVMLLRLKQTIDNLLKRSSQATTVSAQDQLNALEGTALKKSVKRSIYRIVNTFKNYINDLQLSQEVESQLMLYISYKE